TKILYCVAKYMKYKKNFVFHCKDVNNFWTEFTNAIKYNLSEALIDIPTETIAIVPEGEEYESTPVTQKEFSSYRTLPQVLTLFGMDVVNDIKDLKQFKPRTGHVDFAIKYLMELLCVSECKMFDFTYGVSQNIIQLDSAIYNNLKSRKREFSDIDDVDGIYGIVTSGNKWLFIVYTSDNLIASTSRNVLTH
ncbi:13473_t:CDS:2, partial [Funneliformis caledonium]